MPRVRHRYRFPKFKLRSHTLAAILSIVLIATGGALFFTLFAPNGTLLGVIRTVLFSAVGWGIVFVPILLLLTGLMLTRLPWWICKPNVALGAIVSFFSLMTLTGMLNSEFAGTVGTEIYRAGASVLSPAGITILSLSLFFIGMFIVFDTTFVDIAEWVRWVVDHVTRAFEDVHGTFRRRSVQPGQLVRPLRVRDATPSREEQQAAVPKTALANVQTHVGGLGTSVIANLPQDAQIWEYPPLSLLSDKAGARADRGDLKQSASIIEKTLESFGIHARVVEVNCGPAVTQYALDIALGTKLSKITALQNDLALALATPTGTVRIEAPIPGKSLVGIEIPNRSLEIVTMRNILASTNMQKEKSRLAISLGLNVAGEPLIADIARMPHVLIAGTTGSGKSVMINAIIACLLFRNSPQELKFIMIDPKRVEFTSYNGVPHLLTPVIVELDKILSALKWALTEMDRRYKLFANAGVRNVTGYNEMSGFQALPYIVIVIDELADLMMFAPVEVEDAITRIAQMARATGIHLVVATQRPSVDVITGLIKANIPCRIAFNVSSMVDSRVILDTPGAEKLLGRGDMLYMPPDMAKPIRVQGVFVSDEEVNRLIDYLKKTGFAPEYTEEVTQMPTGKMRLGAGGEERDELFDDAVRTICQYDRASASLLQRRLRVGYARAARLLDELEAAGIVGPGEGSKPRDVLVRNADEYFAQQQSQQ